MPDLAMLQAENDHLHLVVEYQRRQLQSAKDCYDSLELAYQRQKQVVLALADKLAICAELLGSRAEKVPCNVCAATNVWPSNAASVGHAEVPTAGT